MFSLHQQLRVEGGVAELASGRKRVDEKFLKIFLKIPPL